MKKLIFIVILLTFILACNKQEDFSPKSIKQISALYQPDLRPLSELRLALSKTVASGLNDSKFREYIQKTSRANTTRGFNEILLEVHKRDIIKDNLSLEAFLKQHVPSDAKEIFGDSLFHFLYRDDPCVVIKIPDIFYDYKWDIHKVNPMVYAGVPSEILNPPYFAFHASGYQEEFIDTWFPTHFYITVKLSEDYSLYDINTWNNEKNINLDEVLPQAFVGGCWDKLEEIISKSGIAYSNDPNRKYIHRFKAFEIWREHCSYKGPLLMNNPCGKPNLRDCVGPGESKLILKSYKVHNEILFLLANNKFGDSFFWYCNFLNKLTGESTLTCLPAIRYINLNTRKVILKEKFVTKNFECIGKVLIPSMEIDYGKNDQINEIEIGMEVVSSFDETHKNFSSYYCVFNDLVKLPQIPHVPFQMSATIYVPEQRDAVGYSDTPPLIYSIASDIYFVY